MLKGKTVVQLLLVFRRSCSRDLETDLSDNKHALLEIAKTASAMLTRVLNASKSCW